MATDKKRANSLGLTRNQDFQSSDEIWMNMLRQKFTQPLFNNKLKKTHDAYLLEFSKSARWQSEGGNPPNYAGIVQENLLYGKNQMGKYLMKIREELE